MSLPSTIDSSRIMLSDNLRGLVDRLARKTHELWVQQRLSEGWRYELGKRRVPLQVEKAIIRQAQRVSTRG